MRFIYVLAAVALAASGGPSRIGVSRVRETAHKSRAHATDARLVRPGHQVLRGGQREDEETATPVRAHHCPS